MSTTTDIILYHPETDLRFFEIPKMRQSMAFGSFEAPPIPETEILFVTSFPPRECGIATYSQDLLDALNDQFRDSFKCAVCALESDTEQHTYAQAPKFILNTDQRNSFVKTAFSINRDDAIKLVVIQHEFGFFDKREHDFKRFLDTITKPIIFVFHTVLPKPNAEIRSKVLDMSAVASAIIVMTNNAAAILNKTYGIPNFKINVIPHGTHLVPPLERAKLKKHFHLANKTVLSTFGLLSKSKSIETTIDALPAIVARFPDVLFLILGKTHPTVAKNEGESYRHMLEERVLALGLQAHVRFVNEYLPLPKLLEYLQLTDVYLFTSKDPHQAVSGTFSYALSCGCPVISTPIPHAKEVLSNNNGVIIDFENPVQLANAVIKLLANEKLMSEISSNSFHKMASTAWQNSAIAHAKLFETQSSQSFLLNYSVPEIKLDYIKKMTTDFGMVQFAKISSPDLNSGYTLDDNARALIAMCQYFELTKNENHLKWIVIYLNFMSHCMQANGKFLNYCNTNRQFTDQNSNENLEDSFGRAIWALGYVSSLTDVLPLNLTNQAENLLKRSVHYLDKMHSTRAMAFVIKGLYFQNKEENKGLVETLANRMENMYKHEKSNEWFWFENYLTYGNSLLPEAMLCAYERTGQESFKKIAKESFDFLLSKTFAQGKIKVISNKGWLKRDEPKEIQVGGEQPIDVAYSVLALERFYAIFKKEEYRRKATVAFSWFLGNNHLNQIVYNPCTGGCYDGVEEFNVNLNQGAESAVSYFMARLAIERLNTKKLVTLNASIFSEFPRKAVEA